MLARARCLCTDLENDDHHTCFVIGLTEYYSVIKCTSYQAYQQPDLPAYLLRQRQLALR